MHYFERASEERSQSDRQLSPSESDFAMTGKIRLQMQLLHTRRRRRSAHFMCLRASGEGGGMDGAVAAIRAAVGGERNGTRSPENVDRF